MRRCPCCKGELKHEGGWERSARERGGNALEVDFFVCQGCKRRFRHQVDERFSGDIHGWWVQSDGAAEDDWELLQQPRWPTFG